MERDPAERQPVEQALALADIRPEERVLDLSGLAGGLALRVAGLVTSVEAVQPDDGLAEEGRRLASTLDLDNVYFHTGALHALPFDAGQFSLALWCRGLSQQPLPLKVLSEVKRVLAPGGRLILQDVTAFGLSELDLRIWELERRRYPGHLLFYTAEEIETLVTLAGLVIKRSERGTLTQDFGYWAGDPRLTDDDIREVKQMLFALTPPCQDLIDLTFTDASISFSYPVVTMELIPREG